MLDLAVTTFIAASLIVSLRLRWWTGMGLGAGALAAWALLIASGLTARGADRFGITGAWMLLFLGPSSVVDGSGVLSTDIAHLGGLRFVASGLLLAGFVDGALRARKLSPISADAVRWNRATIAFLPALLVVGVQLLLFALATLPD